MPITASKITRSNFKLARLHTNEHPVGKNRRTPRRKRSGVLGRGEISSEKVQSVVGFGLVGV